jgi:hypothetical protein
MRGPFAPYEATQDRLSKTNKAYSGDEKRMPAFMSNSTYQLLHRGILAIT